MLSMGYGEKSTAMLKMIKQDVHNWWWQTNPDA